MRAIGGAYMATARKKILCIEDDRETATQIAKELVDRGFDVNTAHDGLEGFIAIVKDKPDLVLCDVSVPTMSGFEVLEHLSAVEPRLGHTPLMFLTALADRDNELEGRQLGADDVVTRPIDFDVLATIISARLAGVAHTKLQPKLVQLNDHEIETLTWVARGKTSAAIAQKLGLVKRTVDFHIDNAKIKLGAATRTEAAIKAAGSGLIEP
jgi:DNA-binding response OmpR family regulator